MDTRTSTEWWQATRDNPEALTRGLTQQYRGEVRAGAPKASISHEEQAHAMRLGYAPATISPVLEEGDRVELRERWTLHGADGEAYLLTPPYQAEAMRLLRFIEFTARMERALDRALAAFGLDSVQLSTDRPDDYLAAFRAIAREATPAEWVEVFPPLAAEGCAP